MSTTNWVNVAETALVMDNTAPSSGAISKGTLTKTVGQPATDYGIDVTFDELLGTPTGAVRVFAALAGTTDVDSGDQTNAELIGSHTPKGLTSEVTSRFSVAKAFSGQVPDQIDIWVLNDSGDNMANLVVTPVRGFYETV